MGFTHFRNARDPRRPDTVDPARTPWMRYSQGFLTSASNPKAIVFFAALFPQFVDTNTPAAPLWLQFTLLGAMFLVIDGTSVFLYAATAGRLSAWLSKRGRLETQRRVSGSVLLGAAALLAMKGAPADR